MAAREEEGEEGEEVADENGSPGSETKGRSSFHAGAAACFAEEEEDEAAAGGAAAA